LKQKKTGIGNGVIVVGGRIEKFRVNLTGAKPHLFQYIMYGSSPELVDQHKPDNDIKPSPIDFQTLNNLSCIEN